MFDWTVIDSIKKHALQCYPDESCGLVAGGAYHRCENEHEKPSEHFRIAAVRFVEIRNKYGAIDAVVHSHPDGPDYPSFRDQEEQISGGISWGICVVTKGEHASDPFWWGDQVPIASLETRRFRHGIHDCYGFVRDWLRVHLQVNPTNIPREYEFWDSGSNTIIDRYLDAGFRIIDRLEIPGDVGVYKIRATVPNHCAVYVGDDLLMHHFPDRLPCDSIMGRWEKYRTHAMRYTGRVA